MVQNEMKKHCFVTVGWGSSVSTMNLGMARTPLNRVPHITAVDQIHELGVDNKLARSLLARSLLDSRLQLRGRQQCALRNEGRVLAVPMPGGARPPAA